MNFRKNSKGITLIALVITIIVLLILAGVSLSLVTGSNGILGKAGNAVNESNKATAREEIELVIAELATDYYFNDEKGELFDYLKTNLTNYTTASGAKLSLDTNGDITYINNNTSYMFSVDKNGKVQPRISGLYAQDGTMTKTWNQLIEEGIITVTDGTVAKVAGKENELEGKLVVDETVTTIGGSGFFSCSKLTEINLPYSVTRICSQAFAYCTALATVNIPQKVTTIESYTFANNVFETFIIPEGVTTIGGCNFYGCSKLTSVTIPSTVTTMGNAAILGGNNLTIYAKDFYSSNIPEGWDKNWNPNNNTVIWADQLYEVPTSYTYSFKAGNNVTAYIYPLSDNSGNELLFYGTGNMYNELNRDYVGIPWGCTAYGDDRGIVSAKISYGITSIACWTFTDLSKLSSVHLPSTVTTIGDGSFCRL